MQKRNRALKRAALALAALMTLSASASAIMTPPPPVLAHGGGTAAPGWGVIGIAGALVFYDLVRRTTCSGDFLNLGGPGFSQPMRATDNALVPRRCRR